jgi:hypothetical protein
LFPAAPASSHPAASPTGGTLHGVAMSGKVPLPGVTVTAQNTLTGKRYSTTTDINGAWSRLTFGFEPPASGEGPIGRFGNRANSGGNFNNPNLKPAAAAVVKERSEILRSGEDYPNASLNCYPMVSPYIFRVQEFQVVPKKDELLFIFMQDHQVRRVKLNAQHPARLTPSWWGDSVGHYEGDTLVVDTIGMNDKTVVDVYRTPHTEKLHVVERWRMVDGGKAMEAVFTVDDPDAFNQPWTGMRHYRRAQQEHDEIVCAENNSNNIFDYHIPKAEKPDF